MSRRKRRWRPEAFKGPAIGPTAQLREHEAHPEAARFLDGIATGISRVTARLKGELDWDECPF